MNLLNIHPSLEIQSAVQVSERAAVAAARGVLWIYANEIDMKTMPEAAGAWCRFERGGRVVGTGYANRHSLIGGRVVAREAHEDLEALLGMRLMAAFERRIPLRGRGAVRLVFSESDFLPGLILDDFNGALVLQSGTAGMDAALPALERLVPEAYARAFGAPPRALVLRGDAGVRALEGVENFARVALGDEDAVRNGVVEEDGLKFAADFLHGQKTGYFLDQRDNRAFLADWLRGSELKTVLDVFCHSGGWGVRALAAGADHCVFVDESAEAIRLLERTLELNGIPKGRALVVKSGATPFLEADQGKYGAVVTDPPAFVKSRKNLGPALRAYQKLGRLGWRRVSKNGVLVASSCSHLVAEEDFLNELRAAIAKESGWAHVIHRGGQAPDHPVLLSMPETRYLKCVALRKLANPL